MKILNTVVMVFFTLFLVSCGEDSNNPVEKNIENEIAFDMNLDQDSLLSETEIKNNIVENNNKRYNGSEKYVIKQKFEKELSLCNDERCKKKLVGKTAGKYMDKQYCNYLEEIDKEMCLEEYENNLDIEVDSIKNLK